MACEARPGAQVTLRQGIRVVEGHGRSVLADDLGAEDPFGLAPGEIVERIVAAGYTPWIEAPAIEPLPMLGTVTEVEREGLVYLVAISRDAEEIGE